MLLSVSPWLVALATLALTSGCAVRPRWHHHHVSYQAPGPVAPSRVTALAIPAPAEESWIVVYNDLADPYTLVDGGGKAFGTVAHGDAAVLRLPPGPAKILALPGGASCTGPSCEAVALETTFRSTCIYFGRIVERTVSLPGAPVVRRAELSPESRNNAAEWLSRRHVTAPRWPSGAASLTVLSRVRVETAPSWFQDDAVCERPLE